MFGDRDDTDRALVFVVPATFKAQEISGRVPIPTLLLETARTDVKFEDCKSEAGSWFKFVEVFQVPILTLLLTILNEFESVDHA